MDKPAKDAIHDLVLNLRKTLEAEVERELGRYGITADRAWIDASALPRLSAKERDEDRPRIEAAIARERDAGLGQAEAVRAYIRETAYTHMNRLLGLKCMEARGLIEETVTTRPIYSQRSKRHRDYLDAHPRAHRAPDQGLVAMLQQAYAEVSRHIGVAFDPESDHTIVWPRHTVLKECIDRINGLDEVVARKRGEDAATEACVYADDTVLGWVYQYFQEKEKDRVFREVRTKKKKIGGYDIVPATTIYTEHYMVQFLVENSLGALWMEMHPDSDLCERWEYFVEDPNLQNEDGARLPDGKRVRKQGRDPRPVAELTLLDPATGSGHFLLYAFDLFAQMYEAEARMQGRPVDRAEIARRILRHNLHGIDIDLRSIQLSAVNLYMKACTYAGGRLDGLRNSEPVHMNLVCADIVLHEGPELEELLDRFKHDPLTQDLIETIWRGLQNARELGSLLKVEEQVDAVIARKREAERGTFWEHPDDAWDLWKQDFLDTLKDYVDRAAESFDVNRRMFGQEAIKGVQLLDLLTHRYDVVATNPPYMHTRNMGDLLRDFLKDNYRGASLDVYAAFITRCLLLGRDNGIVAMVTQQSFMFISMYEDVRETLMARSSVRTLAQLGPGAFEDIAGEVVSVALFCLKIGNSTHRGCYFRLIDTEDKTHKLRELALDSLGTSSALAFVTEKSVFDAIAGRPLVYWMPTEAADLFRTAPALGELVIGANCTKTGNNDRFLRQWWEVSREGIGPNRHWVCYTKGGEFARWYGNLDMVVNWSPEARQHYRSDRVARITQEQYWYKSGITYNGTSSKGFSTRYVPGDCVYDMKGPLFIPQQIDVFFTLALCNSVLVGYFLDLLTRLLQHFNNRIIQAERLPR